MKRYCQLLLKMKLHLISDLHLEFYSDLDSLEKLCVKIPTLFSGTTLNPIKGETTDVTLILAGDVGSPTLSNYWNF